MKKNEFRKEKADKCPEKKKIKRFGGRQNGKKSLNQPALDELGYVRVC